jgi:hypothetical protein
MHEAVNCDGRVQPAQTLLFRMLFPMCADTVSEQTDCMKSLEY